MKAEIAGLRVAVFTFGPLIPALSIKLVFFPQQPVVKAGVRAFGIDVTALLFHALAGMATAADDRIAPLADTVVSPLSARVSTRKQGRIASADGSGTHPKTA